MEAEIAGALAQFGAAGLIGWMWLTERRSAAHRERELSEAHRRIVDSRHGVDVLVGVVESNTRALASLERGQMELVRTLHGRGGDGGIGAKGAGGSGG